MIVLSCGCEVDDFDHAYDVMYKTFGREGNKAIAHALYCGACEDGLRQAGKLFDTDEEAYAWLKTEDW